jgi:hypothetical protein
VGAIMLIELGNRELALVRSEGSAMRLFGFSVDSASLAPWLVAIVLLGLGLAFMRRLWPGVETAWGTVNARLREKAA